MDRTTLEHAATAEDAPAFARGSAVLEGAYAFARDAHAGQQRKGDDSPFIGHPVTVARLLRETGQPDEVVAAGFLHDTVESGGASRGELAERFGAGICRLVDALTEDPRVCEYEMRKRALRDQVETAGPGAAAIYAADKLSNLRDMRAVYERDAATAADRYPVSLGVRIALWRGDLEMAERVAPGLPFLRDLHYELEAFEEARAGQERESAA